MEKSIIKTNNSFIKKIFHWVTNYSNFLFHNNVPTKMKEKGTYYKINFFKQKGQNVQSCNKPGIGLFFSHPAITVHHNKKNGNGFY